MDKISESLSATHLSNHDFWTGFYDKSANQNKTLDGACRYQLDACQNKHNEDPREDSTPNLTSEPEYLNIVPIRDKDFWTDMYSKSANQTKTLHPACSHQLDPCQNERHKDVRKDPTPRLSAKSECMEKSAIDKCIDRFLNENPLYIDESITSCAQPKNIAYDNAPKLGATLVDNSGKPNNALLKDDTQNTFQCSQYDNTCNTCSVKDTDFLSQAIITAEINLDTTVDSETITCGISSEIKNKSDMLPRKPEQLQMELTQCGILEVNTANTLPTGTKSLRENEVKVDIVLNQTQSNESIISCIWKNPYDFSPTSRYNQVQNTQNILWVPNTDPFKALPYVYARRVIPGETKALSVIFSEYLLFQHPINGHIYMEEFVVHPYFNNYALSPSGLLTNVKTKKITVGYLPPKDRTKGTKSSRLKQVQKVPTESYIFNVSAEQSSQHTYSVAKLVWETFIGPIHVDFKIKKSDGNSKNNDILNMYLAPRRAEKPRLKNRRIKNYVQLLNLPY